MPTLDVGGASLYYRETGHGRPLLLIHGTGAHSDLFGGAVAGLSHCHRVIVYDRRGHSRSGARPAALKGYLSRQVEDAAALLRGLNAAPAAVVGWSMGGLIALCLALEHPDLVERLVLCEPPFHASKHMPLSNLWPLLKAQGLSLVGRKRQAAAVFLRTMLARPDGSNAYGSLDESIRDGVLVNAATLLHELKTGTGEELTAERLRQLKCPIAAILGSESPPVFAQATQRLLAVLPQMRVNRIDGAGHIAVMTHPSDFARLTLQS